jgi:hypothetical protein
VAILAGLVGQQTTGMAPLSQWGGTGFFYGGFCSPFDVAQLLLLACTATIALTW